MRLRIRLFALVVSLVLFAGMTLTAAAGAPTLQAAQRSLQDEQTAAWPLLLWLEPPCPSGEAACPAGMQGIDYDRQAAARLGEVLSALEVLRALGAITDFAPLPAANAVGVLAGKDALPALEALPRISKISQGDDERMEAARQSYGAGRAQAAHLSATTPPVAAAAAAGATDPSVYVDDTSDAVWGYTAANTGVSVTLRNSGGGVKGTGSTTSGSNGYYWVSFWSPGVVPGDTAAVTAAGRTVSVHVESLTARIEPATDYVRGTGPAGRNIWISVSSNPGCSYTSFDRWAYSSSAGAFAAYLGDSGNILRGDSVRVFVVDGNNNGTMIARYAPIAQVYNLYSTVAGYTTPNAAVTAILRSGSGSVKETRTADAQYDGYYYAYFSTAAGVGDRVDVTADGETMSVAVATLTAKVAAAPDTVAGSGPEPGKQLKVQACHVDGPYG